MWHPEKNNKTVNKTASFVQKSASKLIRTYTQHLDTNVCTYTLIFILLSYFTNTLSPSLAILKVKIGKTRLIFIKIQFEMYKTLPYMATRCLRGQTTCYLTLKRSKLISIACISC